MTIDLAAINYLAVVVSVIANMAGGALWYSPVLFANPWGRMTGLTREVIAQRGAQVYKGYAISIVASIVIVLVLAVLVQATGATTALDGLTLGLLAGIGLVATNQASAYAFEGRPLSLYLINVGYPVVAFAGIGVLLALWQ